MSAQYSSERRVTKTPAVERVSQFDSTAKLDLGRQRKFEAALANAGRKESRTFADAETRATSTRKK